MIADKTEPGSPASIAAVGLGLSAYVVGVERNLLSRTEAGRRTLKVLSWLRLRGVFRPVADLGNNLRKYIRAYSKSAQPYRWNDHLKADS